jgi:hypothetical protein
VRQTIHRTAIMSGVGTIDTHDAAAAEVPHVGTPERKDGLHGRRRDSDSMSADTVVPPTDEEMHSLRRIPAPIPWICFTIAFVELCERFAYYGTTAVSKLRPWQSQPPHRPPRRRRFGATPPESESYGESGVGGHKKVEQLLSFCPQ